MTRFQCSKCHYSMDKEVMPKRCPYCGEEGAMGKAKGAQELINESDRWD